MKLFSAPDKFYKIVTSDFGSPLVYHYTKGFNQYQFKEDECPESGLDGMYFTNIKYIFAYLDYGSVLLEATFPDGAQLSIFRNNEVDGHNLPDICVDKCVVMNAYYLAGNPALFEYLIKNGADISVLDYNVYKWAYMNCTLTWYMLLSSYGLPDEVKAWIMARNGYCIEEKGEF